MFIQTEATPNPDTVKFIPGGPVMPTGTADYRDENAARVSPLASELFRIQGVAGVFLGADFVAVTRAPGVDWATLKAPILVSIMEFVISGQPVINPRAQSQNYNHINALDDEVTVKIKELIEARVRPAVAADGGDIVFHSYVDGIVTVTMQGACAGCPSSTATLKSGIENMLKHYIPEIREVRAA